MRLEPRRFPFGLTLVVGLAFAICCALGVWQLQRAQWKAHELARIAQTRNAPPAPIGPVLSRARAGEDVTFQRVAVTCLPGPAAKADARITSDNGDWITRVMSGCELSGAAYKVIFVDRGLVEASRGATSAPRVVLPAPVGVIGVLSHIKGDCFGSDGCSYRFGNLGESAPYVLVAESETPPAPGVTPAPYPDAAGNLEYVGAYAPTWFGLAGALACVYAAMLWRRNHPKR